jgi:DNA helicase-2/ATP-dependent DNA helicase PcrA
MTRSPIADAILRDLNPPQREAVLATEGPLLVLAGAGSGKTRVITRRIAYLIAARGVRPWQILAVTFTNKAAGEMKRRVEGLLGAAGLNVWISTFHSTCARLLRKHAAALDLRTSFVIYDEGDQQALIKECLRALNLDGQSLHPRAVGARISLAKNELEGPADFATAAGDYFEERVAQVYRLYEAGLRRANAVDFDDLLLLTVRLFDERPAVLEAHQQLWRYVLVDEYQDTNRAQYRLVQQLARGHGNLCVVGDDDQSIYKWRGADLRNILEFEDDHPGCRVVRLEQNYRSTQRILDAAHGVIARNLGRKPKRLWTENPPGEPASFYYARDEEEEATFVAETIRHLAAEGERRLDDFAVFYRTNAQSRVLEDALRRQVTPYVIVGGVRFYERKEIKDLLAYLRLLVNPADGISLRRVVNVPGRGLGKASLARLEEFAGMRRLSLWDAIPLALQAGLFGPQAAKALDRFRALLARFQARAGDGTVADLILGLLEETGYLAELRAEGTPEAQARLENLKELVSAAQDFHERSEDKGLPAFLDTVALIADVDQLQDGRGAVTLMTLHSAKGLEFPVVFMSGMEEGVFPHTRALMDDDELEEERRLCYVGMTRAKEQLFLTAAVQRRLYGGSNFNLPSRFLDEIPAEALRRLDGTGRDAPGRAGEDEPEEAGRDRRGAPAGARRYEPLEDEGRVDDYRPGARVRHPRWGIGTIRERIGAGQDLKVVVTFAGVGLKKLAVRAARLERA